MSEKDNAYQLASAIAKPHKYGSEQYAVLPKGYKLLDLQKFFGNPDKICETIKFYRYESFIDFVKRYKNHQSVAFSGIFTITVIFDYHHFVDGGKLISGDKKFKAVLKSLWALEHVDDYMKSQEGLPPLFKKI
jgi:hypothetical protein